MTATAPFAHGLVDPWPVHSETGPPRNGAFDPLQTFSQLKSAPSRGVA
jgi:hypothetical protein